VLPWANRSQYAADGPPAEWLVLRIGARVSLNGPPPGLNALIGGPVVERGPERNDTGEIAVPNRTSMNT
jgi:hypothetical protein